MRGAGGGAVLVGALVLSAGSLTASTTATGAQVRAAATYYDAGNSRINARHDGFAAGTPLRARMTKRWSYTFTAAQADISYTVVAGGTVFAMVDDRDPESRYPNPTHGHRLWALSVRTGEVLWARWFPSGKEGTYPGQFSIAAGSGRVYVVDGFGLVRALSPATGKRLWTRDLRRAGYGQLFPPTAAGGRLYFFDTKQSAAHPRVERVQVLDGSTGRTVWQRPLRGQSGSVISVAGKSVYMSGACQNNYRLDRATGAVIWHHVTPDCSGGGGNVPVLNSSGVWVAESSGSVVLSGATGRTIRTFAGRTPAIAGKTAVLLDRDLLHAVSTTTGATRWQKDTSDENFSIGPVISGRTAYFGGHGRYVVGYDIDSGEKVWKRPAGNVISDLTIGGGALVVSANNILVAFS